LKTEPIDYEDDVFDNPPQLDGHMDYLSAKSPTRSDPNETEKRLDKTIAKILAKTSTPNKTIQIHRIPAEKNQFRLKDDRQTKQTPKKSSAKIDRPKQPRMKQPKPAKKLRPRLLSYLLKTNEDIIRPLLTPVPTNNQVNIQPINSIKPSFFLSLENISIILR
jgi:hypothetical protein